jgi:hypothetical protein
MKLNEITRETFEPMVGTDFTLKFENGQEARITLVKLTRIMELVATAPNLKREPFSAYFETPDSIYLPQGMYPFTHEGLGEEVLPIFIVPIAREEGKYRYEAVFT